MQMKELLSLMLTALVLMCSCTEAETNYMGKRKTEIAKICVNLQRFIGPTHKPNQIMIADATSGMSFNYFDSLEDILKSPSVMDSNVWAINFTKPNFWGRRYYIKVFFENNIVVRQKKYWSSDW